MNPQQLHDHIIKHALDCMLGKYNTPEARFMLLCISATESNCGESIKQIGGPALGIWQMEPDTHDDIFKNCDALKSNEHLIEVLDDALVNLIPGDLNPYSTLIYSPLYACIMARLKLAMTPEPLPSLPTDANDTQRHYAYYLDHYHGRKADGTPAGKATVGHWLEALRKNRILEVDL